MSQPELGWDDEERALLKSAELDGPTPGAQKRTLAALGVGGAALSTAVTAGSAKAAAVAGKSFGLTKLLAVLVIGGTAGGAALHYRAQFAAEKSAALQAKPAAKPAGVVAKVAATPEVAIENAVNTEGAPTAPELSPSAAKAPAAPAQRAEPDLALEIESLDRARRASERGDFSGALRELDQYERAFKQGRLRPEALVLRIQTLISKGDVASAKALGGRFLARYPKSPLSPRIQKLLGSEK